MVPVLARIALGGVLLMLAMGHGEGGCACGGSSDGDEVVLGPATGALCPTGSTLTYESFGRPFMEEFCTECHDSAKSGAARQGATAFHDFDTLIGVRMVMDHIDQAAGSGPNATNDQMPPPGNPQPTLMQRQQLAEWIACGAP